MKIEEEVLVRVVVVVDCLVLVSSIHDEVVLEAILPHYHDHPESPLASFVSFA